MTNIVCLFSNDEPGTKELWILKEIVKLIEAVTNVPLPFTKQNAVITLMHDPGNPSITAFPARNGTDTRFQSPASALHWDEAYGVAHLGVQIMGIVKTGVDLVDDFKALLMDIFNLNGGNILKKGNTLYWNVWMQEPELVNQTEWSLHAEYWRQSIDVNLTYPTGTSTLPTYFNGTRFSALNNVYREELLLLRSFVQTHFPMKGSHVTSHITTLLDGNTTTTTGTPTTNTSSGPRHVFPSSIRWSSLFFFVGVAGMSMILY